MARAAPDRLGERGTVDQLHHQRAYEPGFLQTMDVRDVGVIECREDLGLALEPCEALGIAREQIRQDFDGHIAVELQFA